MAFRVIKLNSDATLLQSVSYGGMQLFTTLGTKGQFLPPLDLQVCRP